MKVQTKVFITLLVLGPLFVGYVTHHSSTTRLQDVSSSTSWNNQNELSFMRDLTTESKQTESTASYSSEIIDRNLVDSNLNNIAEMASSGDDHWRNTLRELKACHSCDQDALDLLQDSTFSIDGKIEAALYLIAKNNDWSMIAAQEMLNQNRDLSVEQIDKLAQSIANIGSSAAVAILLEKIDDLGKNENQEYADRLLIAVSSVNNMNAAQEILDYLQTQSSFTNKLSKNERDNQAYLQSIVRGNSDREGVAQLVKTGFLSTSSAEYRTKLWTMAQGHGETLLALAIDQRNPEDSLQVQPYLKALANSTNSSGLEGLMSYYSEPKRYSKKEAVGYLKQIGRQTGNTEVVHALSFYVKDDNVPDYIRLLALEGLLASTLPDAKDIVQNLIEYPDERLTSIYEKIIDRASQNRGA